MIDFSGALHETWPELSPQAVFCDEVALPWFPWELGAGARPFCGRPAPCFGCAFGTAFFGLKCPTSDWRLVLALTFFEIFWIAPFWAMTYGFFIARRRQMLYSGVATQSDARKGDEIRRVFLERCTYSSYLEHPKMHYALELSKIPEMCQGPTQ